MIKVYLDTSVYNRLYHDQSQINIFLEMQATISILNLIETQKIQSVNSFVLEYENQKHPIPEQRNAVNEHLKKSNFKQLVNESIKNRANQLEIEGIKPIDALHVACFEASNCNYFLTCDQRLLNRCKSLSIQPINPIDFVKELDNES
ncbi:PIN domain-containing protein [Okeania sp.]|uniref:PIN domain-containing protein n=1 Tax=Okeania sp. TaxID=3100323 RepID=UPI002B4B6E26|nr:PIN domain-containing protein [Okeania sp.]MEB3341751.1 PIN domain-containing protein [Okeania sp.]